MRIKKIYFFIITLFIFIQESNANIKDKIVAKIGGEIITNYDIINEINTILALSNKPADEKDFKGLQNLAFNNLKKKIIKTIEVKKYKVEKYSKEDVQNYITSLEKNIALQNINLESHFNKFGANYDTFINGVINDLKWNTLIYSLYKKQLDVDEELIESEINLQIDREKEIEEFNLSEIVIENWDEKKFNNIKKNINEIGFNKTATLYSNSVTSAKGGKIGWINSKSISPEYLEIIKKLNNGEISQPIKNNKNLVIIMLNDKRILNQNNLNVNQIKQRVVNKKKQEKLNIFSNSHYLDLERKIFIEINE